MNTDHLHQLEFLFSRLRPPAIFEPTESFYELLSSGEERDLEKALACVCSHLGLPRVPRAEYQWSLKVPSHAAGQIHHPGTDVSQVEIPLTYVGKPYLIGAIIAHELCHELLAVKGIWLEDIEANEVLTDLACFASGLGKLTINAMSTAASESDIYSSALGYITTEANLYAFRWMISKHSDSVDSLSGLLPDVSGMITAP